MRHLLLAILLIPFLALSGDENYSIGGRATGMGNTGLCFNDVWSVRYNQGALADLTQVSAGISYESRFLIQEMGVQSFALGIPTKSGAFGINYTGFGDNLYRESKIGLAYGMRLSKKFNLGIRLNYHTLRLGNNYGQADNLTFEIGILAKPTKDLQIGFHLFNPSQTKLNEYQNEIIPVIMNLGISYSFSDKLRTNLELEKDIDHPFSVKIGLEYKPTDFLYVRAGIATNPSMPTIGFGFVKNNFNIDFSSSFHPNLGITPALGMTYSFK